MPKSIHPIRNPIMSEGYPNMREAELSPEALAAYGALPNLAGNIAFGPNAAKIRRVNPKPWDLRNWDISQYGDISTNYNVRGFVPMGVTDHMALTSSILHGLNSGDATKKQVGTLAHESLHGLSHVMLPKDVSYFDDVVPNRDKFLNDYWFRHPREVREKYIDQFAPMLGTTEKLWSHPLGGELVGPGIPRMESDYDVDKVKDRSHMVAYIMGEIAPHIMRGERHPDLRSPADNVVEAAKLVRNKLSIKNLLEEYRNMKATEAAMAAAESAAISERNQPIGTRPR